MEALRRRASVLLGMSPDGGAPSDDAGSSSSSGMMELLRSRDKGQMDDIAGDEVEGGGGRRPSMIRRASTMLARSARASFSPAAAPYSADEHTAEYGELSTTSPHHERKGAGSKPRKKGQDWLAAVRGCVLFDGLSPAETRFVMSTARLIETPGEHDVVFEVRRGARKRVCAGAAGHVGVELHTPVCAQHTDDHGRVQCGLPRALRHHGWRSSRPTSLPHPLSPQHAQHTHTHVTIPHKKPTYPIHHGAASSMRLRGYSLSAG